jgi:starvation-inducible DNA-binding protein
MNTKTLHQALSDSYALAIKTQNYHWNVTGAQFAALHKLFEAQYDDLLEAIDTLAERIRAKGEKVGASLSVFDRAKTISEPLVNASAEQILEDLAKSQATMVLTLQTALETAQKEGDESTADLLIQRITAHDKNRWMLESSLSK